MNWNEAILSTINVVFIIDAPAEERVKRVQYREELRFGSRVMPGGDMYEQQKEFRDIIRNRNRGLDGTKSIEDNISIIIRTLEAIECEG